MQIDVTGWTEEGAFTSLLIAALQGVEAAEFVRVEDAPASRADAGFAFISNEIYIRFRTALPAETRRFTLPWKTPRARPLMTLAGLSQQLSTIDGIGPPDYEDDGMLQYLRTERVVAPYQTKGVKVVEMVRIYAVGTLPRRES
ncbi:MAG: hypothetical protein NTY02_03300 [Acidobacteria bacterium]|nr:hypothetical protein [Acidobacteriota bacterium]